MMCYYFNVQFQSQRVNLSHCGLDECACCCRSGIKQYVSVYQTQQRTRVSFVECNFNFWWFKISRRRINSFHFFFSHPVFGNSCDRGSINDSGLYSAGPHFVSRPQQLLPWLRRVFRDFSQCLLALWSVPVLSYLMYKAFGWSDFTYVTDFSVLLLLIFFFLSLYLLTSVASVRLRVLGYL